MKCIKMCYFVGYVLFIVKNNINATRLFRIIFLEIELK